ncbi:hypothetical protein [Streptomyces sp. NPDC048445]|uniref:hypothetical protein n=1 Tax=Streptomyces sp. NPDC048445 TaxID=3365553 RepID=UPI003722AB77
MTSVLTLESVPRDKKAEKAAKAAAPGTVRPVGHFVTLTDTPEGSSRPVAHVERELPPDGIPAYLAARKEGIRSFVLWAEPERRSRLATLVTVSTAEGVSTYEVRDGQGAPIGTILREKALYGRGLRTRWTVTQPGCPEAVGYKGRIFWWYVWWLVFPVQVAIGVGSILAGGGDVARGPRRVIWRAGGEVPLEFRSDGDEVHVHAPWVDRRLAAALAALIRSFDSWMGTPWDDKRE